MNKINEIIDGLIFIKDGTKIMSERETINKACDILAKVGRGELVEVVRCGDCKHANKVEGEDITLCKVYLHFMDLDYFCGHGERSVEK